MATKDRGNVGLGLLVGVVSGLAGSWLMLRFIEGPGSRMLEEMKTDEDRAGDAREAEWLRADGQAEPDSVTMQAADVLASKLSGGQHLTHEERAKYGTVVHYAFGGLMGAVYGATAEFWELPTVGLGSVFGTALWLGTDLWSVPAVGFAKWPSEEPGAAHLTHWMAHLVYGMGMEGTRRLLRSRVG